MKRKSTSKRERAHQKYERVLRESVSKERAHIKEGRIKRESGAREWQGA